ncbi:MAG: hypothetical protein AB9917_17310 [Negativicutes bacterium]
MTLAFLAALINLASFHFVHQLLQREAEKYPPRLFNSALLRGFLPNMIWSPSYIAVAVSVQYANLTWLEVAPLGISLAVAGTIFILMVGWFEYGSFNEPTIIVSKPCPTEPTHWNTPLKNLLTLLLQTGILIVLIVSLEHFTHKSAMIIVPLVSIAGPLLLALIYRKSEAYWGQAKDYLLHKLPFMNNEILLFTAIGFFGYSLGRSTLPEHIPVLIQQLGLNTPPTLLTAIVFVIAFISLVGIHPMITIAALSVALTPGTVSLSPLQLAGSYLTGYMLYAVLSPFSAVTLLMGSLSKQSAIVVGLKQNGAFTFIYAVICIAIILLFF